MDQCGTHIHRNVESARYLGNHERFDRSQKMSRWRFGLGCLAMISLVAIMWASIMWADNAAPATSGELAFTEHLISNDFTYS